MNLMHSIRQFLGFPQSEVLCVPSTAVDRMLADLHRLCTTLPAGEVEVFLSNRCVNIQLSWTPEVEEGGVVSRNPETGIVFRLNGRSDRATCQEVVEPAAVAEAEEKKAEEMGMKVNTEDLSESIDNYPIK